MKRIFSIVLALTLVMLLTVSVSADQLSRRTGSISEEPMLRLADAADLLTDSQEADLLARLDQVSEELQCDVVIVTLESCRGYDPDDVIEAYYDSYRFGYGTNRDGVILLLSMAERDWRILSNGFAADAISPGDIDSIGDKIVPELSAGEYYEAFVEFTTLCVYEIEGERNGFPFNFGLSLVVSIAIGFVVALIATGIMRSRLKSVRSQTGAREYTVSGSMQLTRANDLFLYRTLDRRRKPQQTSSGSRGGGGGGRHVGGGKF